MDLATVEDQVQEGGIDLQALVGEVQGFLGLLQVLGTDDREQIDGFLE